MSSVARQVTLWGTGLLVASLAVAGTGTGALLHVQQRRALDEALLAAAHGHAHPEVEDRWEVEHGRPPFDVWVVRDGDRRVPSEALREVRRRERAAFVDAGALRLALLPVESEQDDTDLVIAAAAPRLRLARTVGPFAAIYGALSAAVVVAASVALRWTTRRAFRPVERARREAEAVLGLGDGARLTEDGPDEVRTLLVSVNALLDRLDAAWAAQGRFTAEAAHELRTPVAVMLGEIDVALRHERTPAEYRAVLGSTREEAARLGRIVQALTALVRVDTGEAERQREPLRAVDLAERALAAEAHGLAAAGCAVRVAPDADPEIEGNAALLELALGNLLRNAAAHAPGAPVELRVGAEGPLAVFTVDDGGPGVPVGERAALFERFARAPQARARHAAGLGLGLPLAREIARRHGGDCVLDASPLGGVRARLTVRRSAGGLDNSNPGPTEPTGGAAPS